MAGSGAAPGATWSQSKPLRLGLVAPQPAGPGPPGSSTWLLLKNPTFVLLCLAGATEATLIAGMSTFGPKFLESQFSLSASEAASLFGYLVVPAGGGGTLLGGFLVNKLKLRGSGIIKSCLLCTLTSLLAVLVFLVHCPNVPMAGVTANYSGRCVPDWQRSFALGIQWIVVRTLGGIPGPIAFGWVIDKACLLWQGQCGQQGSCSVYRNSAMSRYLLILGLLYKVLGFLFFAAACLLYKPPSGPSDGLEASLPSQSLASDNPLDLQEAPSTLQLQSDV
ncbi:hypothetical protein CB1_000243004 [Camelus ferus]|nr:hypothetical protein CB1_000243004 [Camelus ferus]